MLVTDDMRVKVSDFGISRLTQEAGLPRPLGPLVRSVPGWCCVVMVWAAYSACLVRTEVPAAIAPAASRCSFIWVVLWELITRQTPWDGVPPLRVMMTVAREDGRLPIPSASECPPIFSDLMRQCFEADPEKRPSMQQAGGSIHFFFSVKYRAGSRVRAFHLVSGGRNNNTVACFRTSRGIKPFVS
ncbi:hypothetical protein PAPYR_11250 [Paratrimastix pyriformis]|uniref:Protein kinase domain-containing protein n=1 Tax=Paratrimastix pyriformis TaxID=342808 RepID=A0ABQ8U6U8_9EUKA|nr:hypothetical protein PAPYR_11250 [Paratrimastix pyriformis]